MSAKGISINVNGGSAALGNVVQGDGNTSHASQTVTAEVANAAFAACLDQIQTLQKDKDLATEEVESLTQELADLKKQIDEKGAMHHIAALAKHIYEQYAWAAKPLSTLFGVLLP